MQKQKFYRIRFNAILFLQSRFIVHQLFLGKSVHNDFYMDLCWVISVSLVLSLVRQKALFGIAYSHVILIFFQLIDIYCSGVVLSLDVTERSPCISKLGIFYITLSKRTETQEENKEPLQSLMRTRMPYFSLNNWRPLSGVFLCHLLVLTHTPTYMHNNKRQKIRKMFSKKVSMFTTR